MTDVFSLAERSLLMSRIRGTGNQTTELRLARVFRALHISGWRRHIRIHTSRPDFTFRQSKTVVFVDGCFWHGCKRCRRNLKPASNQSYWKQKISNNRRRDKRNSRRLRALGWHVIRIWEHELNRNPDRVGARMMSLLGQRGRTR